MFCPRCGRELQLIERTPPPEIDWDSPDYDKQIEEHQQFDAIKYDEYKCTREEPHRCFFSDGCLYHHSPLHGLNSHPGDSWSLSYVK